MKKAKSYIYKIIIFFVFSAFILLLINCAATKSPAKVSQFRFTYNDQVYRIRCISMEEEQKCYNEIMGKGFIALDMDQDRTVDLIKIGDITIEEAQMVYNYGLELLAKENRLKEREDETNQFVHETNDYIFKIRSFQPDNSKPFNELKIFEKKYDSYPELGIMVDNNSDGSLDEVLKGLVVISDFQEKYTQILQTGLRKGQLIKVDNMILVVDK